MVREKRGIAAGKQYFWGLITAIGIASALWCQSFVSLADSTGNVTASSAKIRKEMNINSEVISSVAGGTTVSITDEVQDSSGTLWYQVSVNGKTGYIRSDLVSKTDDAADSQGGEDQIPPGATVTPDTVLDAQYATISADSVNVRSAPATKEGIVDKLKKDVQVIAVGESQGSDGMKWYCVIFIGADGTEKSGFIRSDLLTLGEMVSVAEEETPEVQEAEPELELPTVKDDYELYYDQTDDEWYIYDYADPEHPGQVLKYPLKDLMQVTKARSENDAANAKTLVRQRVAIVILVVLLVLLVGVAVIMALKLRNIYYENDEDEDEEEEEETPRQRRRRTQEDEEANIQRRRPTEETEAAATRRRRRKDGSEGDTERPVRRRQVRDERGNDVRETEDREDKAEGTQVRTAQKRKPKNFLMDDDEFEFEFLNMEDKD